MLTSALGIAAREVNACRGHPLHPLHRLVDLSCKGEVASMTVQRKQRTIAVPESVGMRGGCIYVVKNVNAYGMME
jgi:hypothetical protein